MTPTTIVKTPTTARASDNPPPRPQNGAIFNSAAYRPLFEDRRPRMIGDMLTINIAENTSATKDAGSSASKKGGVNAKVDTLFGDNVNKATFGASSDNSYQDKAATNSSNKFSGSITVTVIDVTPNGNLVVSGDKQIAFDKGTEFVRFSGVVNPDFITQGNNVSSTKVADARIEYRTNSRLDGAEVMNILTKFFLSFAPL